jgi:16S rRNA (guanine527-N7)-methyltransferase
VTEHFVRQLEDRLAQVGLTTSGLDIDRLERYLAVLGKWNAKLNLTALPIAGFPSHTLDRLIVDPMIAAQLMEKGSYVWVDLGSGGGSPAVPLKIANPHAQLAMVDSAAKKAVFLTEVSRSIGLSGIRVVNARIEDLPDLLECQSVQLVTVRAVRLSDGVSRVVRELLRPGGLLLRFGSAGDPPQPGFREVVRRPLTLAGSVVSVSSPS